jgi:tetratricopeptide (TPR) repeat protein
MPNPADPSVWTTIMRFTPAALATALIFATVSSTSLSAPTRPAPISELSRAMEAEGQRLLAAGELDEAIGFFETALVADARNANAFIGLGQIARTQELPGKAIGYFREALALDPESRAALAGQGEAMVTRGAVDRARQNLTRLQVLCGGDQCAEVARLSGAITAAGARTALRTEDVMPRPTVEAAPQASN